MHNNKTHKRTVLGIEFESRAETAAIIAIMVLCVCLAVMAAIAITS